MCVLCTGCERFVFVHLGWVHFYVCECCRTVSVEVSVNTHMVIHMLMCIVVSHNISR